MSTTAPKRLLVFLHGAGSSPEMFAPVAIAWQLKFPGAHVVLLQGLQPARGVAGSDWFDAALPSDERRVDARASAQRVAEQIRQLQAKFDTNKHSTILVGFSQGATLALEVCRLAQCPVQIVVSYAGRLLRPIGHGEHIDTTIHLIHGELDSWVPLTYAQQALRGLRAIGAQVTLDVTEDGIHSIGTDMIILGTTRAMQTIFKGRSRSIRLKSIAGPGMPPPTATLH